MSKLYMATNKANGKIYIGAIFVDWRSLDHRIKAHASCAKNGSKLRFHCAIRKHGIDRFEWTELASNLVEMDVRKHERTLIQEMRATDFAVGYNSREGGSGGWVVPESKYAEWVAKIAERSAGDKNGNSLGMTDDEIVDACVAHCISVGRVVGIKSMREAGCKIPSFGSSKKTKYRFNGLGNAELYRRIEEATGFKYNPYYRSPEQRKLLSEANKGKPSPKKGIKLVKN